ncbi:EthD family reductase [Nocardia sp. NPDC059691]|uniref:EthD family reductase n=1 Tax=Nocardia sp. NPDC059691 TaxID=3346908 RepID=UPI003692B259
MSLTRTTRPSPPTTSSRWSSNLRQSPHEPPDRRLLRRPTDPAAFDEHYRSVHIPLTLKVPGLKDFA